MPIIKKRQVVNFDGLQVKGFDVFHSNQYFMPVIVAGSMVPTSGTSNLHLHSGQTKLFSVFPSATQRVSVLCLITASGVAGGNLHLKQNGSIVTTVPIPASIATPTLVLLESEHATAPASYFELDIENLDGIDDLLYDQVNLLLLGENS